MSKVVVIAEHRVQPRFSEEFAALVRAHAKRCVDIEPGCLVFSVSRDAQDEHRWHYYEVYRSQAEFDAHCAAPHYLQQIERVKPMIDGDVRFSISHAAELASKL